MVNLIWRGLQVICAVYLAVYGCCMLLVLAGAVRRLRGRRRLREPGPGHPDRKERLTLRERYAMARIRVLFRHRTAREPAYDEEGQQ